MKSFLSTLLTLVVILVMPFGDAAAAEDNEPFSIPRDPSLPLYALSVAPMKIVAVMERPFHERICGKLWKTVKKDGKYEAQFPSWGWRNCGGTMKFIDTPKIGYAPAGKTVYVGEQAFPFLNPKTLAAQMQSALAGVANFRVLESLDMSRSGSKNLKALLREGEQGPYLVRGVVTELEGSSDQSESGSGVTITNALLGGMRRKEASSFIRIELRLIDGQNGRILHSFSTVGTSTESELRFELFQGAIEHTEGRTLNNLLGAAARDALEQGAKEIFEALQRGIANGESVT